MTDSSFFSTDVSFEKKIVCAKTLSNLKAHLSKPWVFTNGCFDIIHRGHVTYLAQARTLGRALVVALNSDASIKRLNKAPDRPFNTLEDRLAVVAALGCVDYVTWFDEDTPYELIQLLAPDVLVKGGDWSRESIVGADLTLARGGQVISIPFIHQRSTTGLITKIRTL